MTFHFKWLKIPTRGHPLVRALYEKMLEQRVGVLELSARSGVNANTLKDWRARTCPTVDNLEACFNAVGYTMTIVPIDHSSPAEKRRKASLNGSEDDLLRDYHDRHNAAKAIRVNEQLMRKLDIPFTVVAGRKYWKKAHLREWLERQEQK
jgi:hypothetical protein